MIYFSLQCLFVLVSFSPSIFFLVQLALIHTTQDKLITALITPREIKGTGYFWGHSFADLQIKGYHQLPQEDITYIEIQLV